MRKNVLCRTFSAACIIYDYEIAMFPRQKLIANERIDFYIDSNMADQLKVLPFREFRLVLDIQLQFPFPENAT